MISRSLPRCFFSLLAVTAALATSGCVADAGDPSETEENVSTNSEAIINGTVISAEGSGYVLFNACSGTLVTNTWAITAKHCNTVASSTVQMGSQAKVVDFVVDHPSLDVTLAHISSPMSMGGSTTGYLAPLRTTQLPAGTMVNCSGYGQNTIDGGFGTLRTAAMMIEQAGNGRYMFFRNTSGQIMWFGDSGTSCKDSSGNIVYVHNGGKQQNGSIIEAFGPSSDVLAGWVGADALFAMTNPIDRAEVFIRQTYLDVLGREPDSGGLAWWVSALQGCNGAPACLTGARVDMARGMLESPESRANYPELNPASAGYKGAFLTHCFTSFMQRQPDAAGYNYWLSYLDSSSDYNGVVSSFINSAEYRGRFGAP